MPSASPGLVLPAERLARPARNVESVAGLGDQQAPGPPYRMLVEPVDSAL
jgi:hypothetical protein